MLHSTIGGIATSCVAIVVVAIAGCSSDEDNDTSITEVQRSQTEFALGVMGKLYSDSINVGKAACGAEVISEIDGFHDEFIGDTAGEWRRAQVVTAILSETSEWSESEVYVVLRVHWVARVPDAALVRLVCGNDTIDLEISEYQLHSNVQEHEAGSLLYSANFRLPSASPEGRQFVKCASEMPQVYLLDGEGAHIVGPRRVISCI